MKLALALALTLLSPAALAGIPVPDELKPLCDKLTESSVCLGAPCVCTSENGSADESGTLLQTAIIMRVASPDGAVADNRLIIKTNNTWKDYGGVFTEVRELDGQSATGSIERFWMSYSVEGFGTVLSCDYKSKLTITKADANADARLETSGLILAFVHDGQLKVLEIQRSVDEKVTRLDKKGPAPDAVIFGKEGHRHWKRSVEVLDKGRVRISKRTGNDPVVKKAHQLVGMPVLDILTAFDDEVKVRTPTE